MELSQDFKEFITLLNVHKVEYIVVGGYAVAIHGFPRTTGDIDFWIKPYQENSERMMKVLIDFGFGSVDINIEDFLKKDYVVQLGFPPNRIDIMTSVTGLDFDAAFIEKKEINFEGENINFISLRHLRINKKETGRDKDNLDLKNLPE
jgi:transcriptional/translational regulatory protein YebC/TACO1